MVYALGRGLTYQDMPVVRKIVRDARAQDYRFSALVSGIVQQRAVSDGRGIGRGELGRCMFITRMHLSRRTFLRGVGATLALPMLDAMVPAASALARTTGAAPSRAGFIYMPHGADMTAWTPAGSGGAFELSPTLQPSRAVQGLAGRRQQPDARGRADRDARRRFVRLAERRHSQAHRRRGLPDRHDDRPGDRQADRPDVAVPVARVRDGGFHRLRRRLHAELQLRVPEHDLVGDADVAAADGDQSPRGVRAAVRRRRLRGTSVAGCSRKTRASSIRSSAKRGRCRAVWACATAREWTTTWPTSAKSSAGFSRRRRSTTPTWRWSTSRSAFPNGSTTTRACCSTCWRCRSRPT